MPDYQNLTRDELLNLAQERNQLTDEARIAFEAELANRRVDAQEIRAYAQQTISRERAEKRRKEQSRFFQETRNKEVLREEESLVRSTAANRGIRYHSLGGDWDTGFSLGLISNQAAISQVVEPVRIGHIPHHRSQAARLESDFPDVGEDCYCRFLGGVVSRLVCKPT